MSGRTPAYLAGETEHLLGGVARTTPSEKERELARGRRFRFSLFAPRARGGLPQLARPRLGESVLGQGRRLP